MEPETKAKVETSEQMDSTAAKASDLKDSTTASKFSWISKKIKVGKVTVPLVGLIAGILVLSGGTVAAFMASTSSLPGFKQPQEILKESLQSSFSLDGSGAVQPLNAKGSLDISAADIPQEFTGIDFTTSSDGTNSSSTLEIGLTLVKPKLSIISVGADDSYVKVEGLGVLEDLSGLLGPENTEYTELLALVSGLDGIWYNLNVDDLEGLLGSETQPVAPETSKQDLDAIMSLLADSDMIEYLGRGEKNEEGQKEISGVTARRYDVAIKPEGLKQFIASLRTSSISMVAEIDDADWDGLIQSIDNNNLASYPFKLWVDESAKKIMGMDVNNSYPSGTSVEVSVEFDHNADVQPITAPTEFKSFQELFGDLVSGFGGGNLFAPTEDNLESYQFDDSELFLTPDYGVN